MYNILICDDDIDIVKAIKIHLADPEYRFFEAYDGFESVEIVKNNDIELVLMDIMMPKLDGISAMLKIRQISNVPVVLLTAKSEDADKIVGLNVGADDYITKPFNPDELVARVRSQLRRYISLGSGNNKNLLTVGGIELDDYAKTVKNDGNDVFLTPKEFEILKLLMKTPGKVYSPKEIYRNIWEDSLQINENTVAVHIRHLREKLEIDPANPRYLKVVFGHGYKFEEER